MENKRILWGLVVLALICATLMSFLPPDSWRFAWRIVNGDRINWNSNSLAVKDRGSVWVITKSGQLQVSFNSDESADLYFDYIDGPSKLMALLVDDSCATAACKTVVKFKRRMGVHQADCIKLLYTEDSGHDFVSILCAIEKASLMARYVGPPGLAEMAQQELESLTSQITMIRPPSPSTSNDLPK